MKKNAVSSTKENPSSPESLTLDKISTHTKVTIFEGRHIWKINNFSFLCQKSFPSLDLTDSLTPVNTNITWWLQLFSNSDNNVMLHLSPSNYENGLRAKYRFIIYDGMKKEAKVASNTHFFEKKSSYVVEIMCSLNDIVSDEKKILTNDELTIGWEIKFISSIDTIEERNCNLEFMNSKLHCFHTLDLMFKNRKFCDVKINISGRTFEAHKAILAAASPVFLAMFKSSMTEAEQNYINIDDVDEETFEEMLRFMYTGNVNNVGNVAYTLFAAADKYDIDDLKDICETELCKSLTADNAVRVLILADLHSAVELREEVIKFIKMKQVNVTKTEDFNSIIDSHRGLLVDMISDLIMQ